MNNHSNARTRRTAVIAVSLAVALTLAGCTGAATSTSAAGASTKGDTLTVFQKTPPSSLNPAKESPGGRAQYVDIAYSSFLQWSGPDKFTPALAKSVSFVGEKNEEVQVKLRNNVRFSDGTLLTAQGEKTYLEYLENAGGPIGPLTKSLIKSISTPNSTTVDVYFTSPQPDAATHFAESGYWGSPISPKALAGDTSKLGFATDGAGPYELDATATTTGSTYTYVPNKNFYDKSLIHFNKIVVKVLADTNSSLQQVISTPDSITSGTWQQAATAKSSGLNEVQGTILDYLLVLTGRSGKHTPAIGNGSVREALNYAVDRPTLATSVHGVPNEQIVPKGTTGYYSPHVYSDNIAKAKSLLAKAGYPNGFTFSVFTDGFDSNNTTAAQVLVSDFAKIGVTMKLTIAPTGAVGSQDLGSGNFDGEITATAPTSMFNAAQSSVVVGSQNNPENDSDATLNSLFTTASTASPADSDAAWEKYGKTVSDKAWFVGLTSIPTTFFATGNLDVKAYNSGTDPNPILITTK